MNKRKNNQDNAPPAKRVKTNDDYKLPTDKFLKDKKEVSKHLGKIIMYARNLQMFHDILTYDN